MRQYKCKICRRAQTKLFLKGDRCDSQKCAMIKRNYPPGIHGQKRRMNLSEYGTQLREKQKLREMYMISERQFKNYVKKALSSKKTADDYLVQLLEQRLDSLVFRVGLAESRSLARQLVGHGHFCVNGRKTTIPSYQLKKGDTVSIRKQSKEKLCFTDLKKSLKGKEINSWIVLDKENLKAKITSLPGKKDIEEPIDISLVVEYYSRR